MSMQRLYPFDAGSVRAVNEVGRTVGYGLIQPYDEYRGVLQDWLLLAGYESPPRSSVHFERTTDQRLDRADWLAMARRQWWTTGSQYVWVRGGVVTREQILYLQELVELRQREIFAGYTLAESLQEEDVHVDFQMIGATCPAPPSEAYQSRRRECWYLDRDLNLDLGVRLGAPSRPVISPKSAIDEYVKTNPRRCIFHCFYYNDLSFAGSPSVGA